MIDRPEPSAAALTPALLTTSKYLGTLATARCLGARGVPVVVVSSTIFGPAQWSRAASRVVRGRPRNDPESMLAWLLELGTRWPGAVLHPTSDEMAWIIARHAEPLGRLFRLYTPPFAAIRSLLDKSELHRVASRVGLRTPVTVFPRNESDAERAGWQRAAFVVKPRSQVFYESHAKGAIVSGAGPVARAWRECRESSYPPSIRVDAPDIELPMLQELVPTDGVYSISGFVTRDHEVLGARAARKILQRPSGVGVGVCFEAAPLDASLVAKLADLARETGFCGAFEAEFVGRDHRLIDFNPRYYGQMAFDIARGAPLPWMLHLGALGHDDALRTQPTPDDAPDMPRAYGDTLTLRILLASRRLVGTLSPDDARKWKAWLREHRDSAVDATLAPGDPMPAIASVLTTIWDAIRHPRGFWRSLQGAF